MITLAVDASWGEGSAAVIDNGRVLASAATPMRTAGVDGLLPAVDDVLRESDVDIQRVGRIVCAGGPGSFTGLRIAASMVKGFAEVLGCDLLAVPSLAFVAATVTVHPERVVIAADAGRGDWFVAAYERDAQNNISELAPAALVPGSRLDAAATDFNGRLVKWEWSMRAAAGLAPLAAAVPSLESCIAAHGPVDVAEWQPMYGRLAEAQVVWEARHGRALGA